MSIENEKLKITCPHCQKPIILTFNTTRCPKCGGVYEINDVHQLFYDYESQVANSKFIQSGEKLEKIGDGLQTTGKSIEKIGCFIFMLPLGLFCLYMIFKILTM